MNNKIIGIIGGMGPEATADLYMKIINATKVTKDQDHFRVIIDSNAKIPDRTAAIIGHGESPIKAMVETGKNLEKLGADIALIPCNTAHYFIDEVQKQLSIPILNALIETDKYIKEKFPKATKIGLLATSGTIQSNLYRKFITDFEILYPSPHSQREKIMKSIYGKDGIKTGNTGHQPLRLLKDVSNELIQMGADLIIAGCSEIGLTLHPDHISRPLIDPMKVLAEVVVKE